jgi:hypothetical protein
MRPQSRGGKRQQGWQGQEPETDDLAVAASFAQASTFSTAPNEPPAEDATSTSDSDSSAEENKLEENKSESVDNEASREQDDDSDSDDKSLERNRSVDNEAARENDEDSDDGSELDLKEALEKMQDEDDAGESKKGVSHAPTTEHELDPYRTPLQDLEQKFKLKLTVEEQELLRLSTKEALSSSGQLCEAGNVKCHMIMDRTIVVESSLNGGSAQLDEGTLLVIRVQDEGDARLLPLGKVFEVFGPVSRPLYTIRLPSAIEKEAKKETQVNNNSVERDADEISLNDDEECVKQVPSQEATKEVSSTGGNKDIAATAAASPNGDEVKQHDGTSGDDSVNDIESDPWAPEGNYTKLLQSTQGMKVYYIPDIARLLDTGAIIRNSGRGCGKYVGRFILGLFSPDQLGAHFSSVSQMHPIYLTKKWTRWNLVMMSRSVSTRTVRKRAESGNHVPETVHLLHGRRLRGQRTILDSFHRHTGFVHRIRQQKSCNIPSP